MTIKTEEEVKSGGRGGVDDEENMSAKRKVGAKTVRGVNFVPFTQFDRHICTAAV